MTNKLDVDRHLRSWRWRAERWLRLQKSGLLPCSVPLLPVTIRALEDDALEGERLAGALAEGDPRREPISVVVRRLDAISNELCDRLLAVRKPAVSPILAFQLCMVFAAGLLIGAAMVEFLV